MPDDPKPTHADLTAAGKLGARLEKERAKQTAKRLTLLSKQADALRELEADGVRRLDNIACEYSDAVQRLAGVK